MGGDLKTRSGWNRVGVGDEEIRKEGGDKGAGRRREGIKEGGGVGGGLETRP